MYQSTNMPLNIHISLTENCPSFIAYITEGFMVLQNQQPDIKGMLECFVSGLFLCDGAKLSPAGSASLPPLSDIILHSVQQFL